MSVSRTDKYYSYMESRKLDIELQASEEYALDLLGSASPGNEAYFMKLSCPVATHLGVHLPAQIRGRCAQASG